ncbi:MAG TPA: tetratricopeptide repeat protein, partial [Leptolinea sp.]
MASDYAIIHTRITAPRRRGELVTRQRLNDLLNELIEKRLVLVSAPAGYGKTALLVDFASSCQLPVCWYTIDPLDFDLQRFVAYFVAAIHQRFPAFGGRTSAILASDQGKFDVDYITNILTNDLYENISEHFVLILDDFHLVNESLPVRNFLNRFIQDVEENCHLILTSRTLLSLPFLPVLASRSDVGGISFEELTFQPDEIQQLYQQNQHQNLSLDTAKDIQNRTEGWITGIVLTSQVNQNGMNARTRLERATGFGMEEYFMQVIDGLSPELRSFLLWSSLLEEFNADQCALVLGPALAMEQAPWQEWMNSILQNNLFALPVGDQGDWLRYHPLFLEFLQTFVFREHPVEAQAIKKSLALTYLQNHEWDRAFAIYRTMNSEKNLVDLIETAGPDVLAAGRISTVTGWIDVIPDEVSISHPIILSLKGRIAFSVGDTSLAMTYYDQAIEVMQLPGDNSALVQTLVWRANLFRLMGDLELAISDANQCMDLLKNNHRLRKIKGDALRCIGLCIYHQGKLQEALIWMQKAFDVMRSVGDQKNEAEIQMEIGIIYEHIGDHAHAKESYLSALRYWKHTENQINLSILQNNLGVLQQA